MTVRQPHASSNDAQRKASDRPRWWALLAISLALMALVASISATHRVAHAQATSVNERATAAARATRAQTSTTTAGVPMPPVTTPTTSRATTSPTTTRPVIGSSWPTLSAGSPSTTPATNVNATSGASIVLPAPSIYPPTPSATSTTVAITTPPSNLVEQGYLQYPNNVSATYPGVGTGVEAVTATWTDDATLSLTVTCQGGNQSATGLSGLNVSAPVGTGTCEITLAEPNGQPSTTSYILTIQGSKP